MNRRNFLGAATMLTMAAALSSVTLFAQADANNGPGYTPTTTTTVTNVSGTIAQLNYGSDGTVDGFLIGTNVLLAFPTPVSGGLASLGAVGNSVTYSGTASTTSSGFQNVRVTSFTNNTTKATYTPSTTVPTPVTYGPTSGTVKQLNYDAEGDIAGFVFSPTGSTSEILVVTPPQASATLKPLLTGSSAVTVTVNGVSETANATSCTASGALAIVEATSLTIGSQTIVIAGGGFGGGHGGPGGPRR